MYSLLGNENGPGYFKLNETTGEVSVRRALTGSDLQYTVSKYVTVYYKEIHMYMFFSNSMCKYCFESSESVYPSTDLKIFE